MSARYIVGDVFDVLATLEPDSVDLVFSSPPFLALRSYLPADHPDKGKEIGSEATPADFLDTLLDVVEACDRVLAPHGSLCFELGDTYSGAGGYGSPDSPNPAYNAERWEERFDGRTRKRFKKKDDGWPEAKSLCLIPTLFAASLAYGYNMLRPERTTPRWRVRNLVVWARPNPPVGALGDKFRPATSYVTVACKSGKRYFDLDAVRGEPNPANARPNSEWNTAASNGHPAGARAIWRGESTGAPPLDFWVIPTQPYAGSHYATFPSKLVEKPVASMCPPKVCNRCGKPSTRIATTTNAVGRAMGRASWRDEPEWAAEHHVGAITETASQHAPDAAIRETLGWWDCGHGDWRPGVVLDPFAGSGTTLSVATGHGRDAIGIDLDARNADLALERVGPMFLTVEHLSTEGAA